ncbi:thymidylate kinase [Piedraia hortae CBS 480.64]|uniref:Thymidylate kinase n=1 Tax=Piedraia hortae CBS 480.64 TaxID=1314780 RepID=A0A6A7BV47_9PEZI|nr:thymidylate kinase [Piedraia hortae CBS 480.64]
MPTQRGYLIAFEGLDRSGKSTQCSRVAARIRSAGQEVKIISFPERTTPIGKLIDEYLTSKEDLHPRVLQLLFTANRWEMADKIVKLIEEGTTVILDRYYYSGCAYAAAQGLGLAASRHAEVGLPRPDVCVFLDLGAEEAARRKGFGFERFERDIFQEQVRIQFDELRRHEDEGEDMVIVEAGGTVEDVDESVGAVIARAAERSGSGPLRFVQPWG